MAISKVGKGKIGFIANENYISENFNEYMKDFYARVYGNEEQKEEEPSIVQIDEQNLVKIKNDISSNSNVSRYLALWNSHKGFQEIPTDDLLALVHEGLRLVIAIKPWSYDYYVEKLYRSNIKSLFIAGGLWPSLKFVKNKMKILKSFQYESLPLTYLLDYALTGMKHLVRVSDIISDILQNIPQSDRSFHKLYDPLKYKVSLLFSRFLHFTRSLTPCLKRPLSNKYNSKRKFLKMINVILLNPLGNKFTAPGVSFYPGTIVSGGTISVVSVILDLNIQFSNEVIYLGYYLPPGHVMTVNALIAKSPFCRLHINFHLLDVWDRESWMKWPGVKFDYKILSNEQLSISFAFGGLLSLSCEENNDRVRLSLSGVVTSPTFDSRNRRTYNTWKREQSHTVPWVVLANDVAVFVLPVISLRNLQDPSSIMTTWNFMIKQQFHLKGRDVRKHRRELISTDIQLVEGYMHSGYPIGTQMKSVVNPRDIRNYLLANDYIRKNGNWGLLHEVGHNLQDPLFTFAGTEEVTNNIFTLVAIETLTCIDSWSKTTGWVKDGNISEFISYINDGKFEDWKTNTYLALGIYAQLKDNFGWELYRQIFRKYHSLNRTQLIVNETISDRECIQLWIRETSRLTKLNLIPLYELWRIPVDYRTVEELKIYPSFLPQDFLTEMVNETVYKIIAKYGGLETVLRKPKEISITVGPLVNPSKITGKPSIIGMETVESD